MKHVFRLALLVAVITCLPIPVLAEEDGFAEQKKMVIDNITNLEGALKRERTCVDQARTKKDLRACYDKYREEKKEFLNKTAPPIRRQQGKGYHERIGE